MITRRDFLKLSALGLGTLALHPPTKLVLPEFVGTEKLGRVTVGKVDVFMRPDANSQVAGSLYEDSVIPWIREVVGLMPSRINQRFVETRMDSSGVGRFNRY